MKVNRYTQYTPAEYNPRSLEELMVAPMYMRQQHDQLDTGIAAAETALAQVDNDPLHNDLVSVKQKQLQQQLQQQAEQLQKEGFNNSNKSAFIRFNSDYQNAIGPKGILGQANAYKTAKKLGKDTTIANMTKAGYSSADAERWWNKHVESNESEFDGKTINPFQDVYAPNYEDLEKDIDTLTKSLGAETVTKLKQSGARFDYVNGQPVFVTAKGQVIKGSNEGNIKDAIKVINDKWLNESGDGYKANQVLGYSEDYIKDAINNRFNVAKQTSIQDTRNENYQLDNYGRALLNKKQEVGNGQGLTYSSTQYIPDEITSKKYSKLKSEIEGIEEKIRNKGSLTNDEKSYYNQMKSFYDGVQADLVNNPIYSKNLQSLQALQDDFYKMQSGEYDYSKDDRYKKAKAEGNTEVMHLIQSEIQSKNINEQNKIETVLNDIGDETSFKESMAISEYVLTPSTPKEEGILQQLNNNATRIFRTNPQSAMNLGTIMTATMPSGTIINGKNDSEGISKLIYDASRNGQKIEVDRVVRKGASGKPEIVFLIPTTKDIKYDVNGVSLFNRDTGYMGGGDTVSVRIAFDETKDPVNINNLMGLAQDYISSTGKEGVEFVESQNINATLSKYEGENWSNFITENNQLVDRNLVPILREELKRMGLTESSSNEDKKKAFQSIKNSKITR